MKNPSNLHKAKKQNKQPPPPPRVQPLKLNFLEHLQLEVYFKMLSNDSVTSLEESQECWSHTVFQGTVWLLYHCTHSVWSKLYLVSRFYYKDTAEELKHSMDLQEKVKEYISWVKINAQRWDQTENNAFLSTVQWIFSTIPRRCLLCLMWPFWYLGSLKENRISIRSYYVPQKSSKVPDTRHTFHPILLR